MTPYAAKCAVICHYVFEESLNYIVCLPSEHDLMDDVSTIAKTQPIMAQGALTFSSIVSLTY